jgi:hypothetical protein
MGGYGSGRWFGRSRRQVVEDCVYLEAGELPYSLLPPREFLMTVRRRGGEFVGFLPCRSVLPVGRVMSVTFDLPMGEETISQVIPVGATTARAGGSRHCFHCPIEKSEGICGQTCRKLYVPPTSMFLGCRKCHCLAYASSQRRPERLAKVDDRTEKVEHAADRVLARMVRGERIGFREMIQIMRQTSHAIWDLRELLAETEWTNHRSRPQPTAPDRT